MIGNLSLAVTSLSWVSASCSCIHAAAEWGISNIVAFASGKLVGLYDVEKIRIIGTLRGHSDRVNCVRWICHDELLSASADGEIIVWRLTLSSLDKRWKIVSRLPTDQKKRPILSLSVTAHPKSSHYITVVATSADKSIYIWTRQSLDAMWELQEKTSSIVSEAVESSALAYLPSKDGMESHLLLALGGVGGAGGNRGSQVILCVQRMWREDPAAGGPAKLKFEKLLTLEGCEDWVRCLSFTTSDEGELLLASSSQDTFVRIWKIGLLDVDQSQQTFLSSSAIESLAPAALFQGKTTPISQRGHIFQVVDQHFSVLLDSILSGHDDWVYSVAWHPKVERTAEDGSRKLHQPLALLTSSMDKTVVLWRPQGSAGIWQEEMRVGELGGHGLGFFGALFSPDGSMILAHGYQGGFHLWHKTDGESGSQWKAGIAVSGHFGAVKGLQWDPSQSYFITVSQDQTARLFAPWIESPHKNSWFEISRPQVHGHDLECICFVPKANHLIVTGAEEKIFRVFEASQSFVHNLKSISGIELAESEERQRPLGASVPPLGLSNKPLFSLDELSEVKTPQIQASEEDNDDEEFDNDPFGVIFISSSSSSSSSSDRCLFLLADSSYKQEKPARPAFVQQPPIETDLRQSTLWPEVQKLYGHGNYTFCISSSHRGDVIATAVNAKADVVQAAIKIWDTDKWKEVQELTSHKLTVTRLAFSKDDRYLLSASRDRQFCVFKRSHQGNFQLVFTGIKAHGRIIWDADWTPDDKFIITVSRDKTAKAWEREGQGEDVPESWKSVSTLAFGSAVTALSVATFILSDGGYLVAFGTEEGEISVWSLCPALPEQEMWKRLEGPSLDDCHAQTVTALRWRTKDGEVDLASCGEDHSVRVFRFSERK